MAGTPRPHSATAGRGVSGALTEDEAFRVVFEQLEANESISEAEADALEDEFVDMILKATLLDLWRGGEIKCSWSDGEIRWRKA